MMTGQALPIRRWNSARSGTVPTKAARHKSVGRLFDFRYDGSIAMVERRGPGNSVVPQRIRWREADIAVAIIRNSQSIAKHYWGADI
jgi:hypothetical protein